MQTILNFVILGVGVVLGMFLSALFGVGMDDNA